MLFILQKCESNELTTSTNLINRQLTLDVTIYSIYIAENISNAIYLQIFYATLEFKASADILNL